MTNYNLRSKSRPVDQSMDGDSQSRKRIRRKPKAKDAEVSESHAEEVIHVESDMETENRSNVGEENNEITPHALMELADALVETDFYDFEKKRNCTPILKGQIWAIYDEYGMPRRYVQIDSISLSTNSICVTFLKHSSLTQEKVEDQTSKEISWFQPVCGSFTPYSKGLIGSVYSFSHIVSQQQSEKRSGRCDYDIYPKTGQVWALYKYDNSIISPRMQIFQLVEIVSDFGENGIKALYLVKYGEYRSLYKRHTRDGIEVSLQLRRDELERFSHQVPSFRILNAENNLLNGCLELDPASLPFYIDSFSDATEPHLNNKILLKVLDNKSLIMKERLKENSLWVMYDDRDGLPRRYALIQDRSGREVITWLEPCPISDDEKKWYKAGLPIVCGNFKLKKTTSTFDYSMLSHPIQCESDIRSEQYTIYPRKGEVWGIYKDWDIGWSSDPIRSSQDSNFEYEFVEILTDFSKNEGVKVVSLTSVGGLGCVFRRQTNDVPFVINQNELCGFSHQIQNCKIDESSEFGNGCLALDPLVVSLNTRENSTLLEDKLELEADKKDCFKLVQGQIWALYEDPDHVPRSYAVISNTSLDGLKVEVKLLKPHPVCEEEMEWADNNLPISCGIFRLDKVATVRKISDFSHQIMLTEKSKIKASFFIIIPQKGEVWAVHQNSNFSNLGEPQRYYLVEIISCFDEVSGLKVALLSGVEGSKTFFQKQYVDGSIVIMTFSRKELLRFSHRVPCSKIIRDGDEMMAGCWKLDSAVMPN